MPKHLESLNELIEERGIATLRKHNKKLQERLSNIGPGFLFDRTDNVLVEKSNDIMAINKYEQTLAEHCRHIIESNESMKSILNKIEDLNKELATITTTKNIKKDGDDVCGVSQ
jgi:chaperonin cofactor prefoldin